MGGTIMVYLFYDGYIYVLYREELKAMLGACDCYYIAYANSISRSVILI